MSARATSSSGPSARRGKGRALGEEAPDRSAGRRTLESAREADETVCSRATTGSAGDSFDEFTHAPPGQAGRRRG